MKPLVLVVEDNELNRDLVEQLLEDDYRVISREDGPSGLDAALTMSPDVVLLDLSLPGLAGTDIARAIRADEAGSRVPIIAVTAHAMPGDAERAMDAGFDAYLTKPLDEDELYRTLREVLDA